MAERTETSTESETLTAFVTSQYYIIGAGESLDEVQSTGEWLATDDPITVRP